MSNAKTPAPSAENHSRLHICAKTDGFRRCGRAWPAKGVTVDAGLFSKDQLATLKSEPELVVTEIEDES